MGMTHLKIVNIYIYIYGEAARSVLAKVGGDVFALFHAVSAKLHSRTWNSQFGLLGQILYIYMYMYVYVSSRLGAEAKGNFMVSFRVRAFASVIYISK
jgi:hypothetical protein